MRRTRGAGTRAGGMARDGYGRVTEVLSRAHHRARRPARVLPAGRRRRRPRALPPRRADGRRRLAAVPPRGRRHRSRPPGFGRTGKRGDGDFTADGWARWLPRFLDAVGVDRVRICAHDWGAAGLLWAAREPGRVERVAVLNGAPLVGGLSLPRHARLLALPGVGEVAVGLALPSVMRRMLRKGIAEGAEPDQAWFDDIAARFDQGTQRAVLRLFRAATPAAREQAGRELRELDVPALVVHGERDPWHPPRTGQAYAAVLPQSELARAPGGRALAVARGSGCRRARPRVPAPLSPGHQGITFVGCSCDSARPPAGSSRTGPSTCSGRSPSSPRRTTSTGSCAASPTTPARRRPRSTTRATSSTSSGR